MSAPAQDETPRGETPGEETDPLAEVHARARVQAEEGDLTGARTLLEDALAAGELRFGRDHPKLAPLMVDLATIARNVGNLTEAQNQLRRAYAIMVGAVGPEHATSLSIEGRLAAVSYRLGEPTEAYDWHIADVGSRVLGPEHPAVRGAQQRLAAAMVVEEETPSEPPYPGGGGWAPDLVYNTAAYNEGAYTAGYEEQEPGVYHRTAGTKSRPEYQEEVWRDAPLPPARVRRTHRGGTALVASLGAVILVAAIVVAYQLIKTATTSAGSQNSTNAPTTATSTGQQQPPDGVRLTDNGGSVILNWVDPSDGTIPFIVAGGRVGATTGPLETVPPGRTTSTIYGLNDKYDYCFTVAAVWSGNVVDPSPQICTNRASPTSPP